MEMLGVPLVLLRMRRPVPVWRMLPLLLIVVRPEVAPRVTAVPLPEIDRVAPAETLPVSPALRVRAVVLVPVVMLKLAADAEPAPRARETARLRVHNNSRGLELSSYGARERGLHCDLVTVAMDVCTGSLTVFDSFCWRSSVEGLRCQSDDGFIQ
jgi:hypothetical protein